MYTYNGSVHVEDDDQCINCEHFNRGVACPLLHALGQDVVSIKSDTLSVDNCGFYKEFKRKLRLIADDQQ